MFKKSIAAALLMVMVAWAEMALAPMLFMQAGHVHAASEMSALAPGQMAAHHHAMPAGHPCCPGLGKTGNTVPFEFAVSGLPCHNDHRCCFRQGPQSVPAPVNARLSRDIAPAEITELSPDRDAGSHVSPVTALPSGPPPGQLAMVLRV
jgi:hypothetical protein